MKVFTVIESGWGDHREFGIFSTREKAEAYIAMVAEAEVQLGELAENRFHLEVAETYLDEAAGYFPIFCAAGYIGDLDSAVMSVTYLSSMPESRFYPTLDLRDLDSLQEVYAAEGFGRTPQEARAQLAEVFTRAAAKAAIDA